MSRPQNFYSQSTVISSTLKQADVPKKNIKKKSKKKKRLRKYKYPIYLGLSLSIGSLVLFFWLQPHKNTDTKNTVVLSELDYETAAAMPLDTILDSLTSATINQPLVQSLTENAEAHPAAKFILSHLSKYPESLLKLAADKPETIEFVAQYPESKNIVSKISIADDYKAGKIPLFLQWDTRWGYFKYGDDFLAINGCGPTCLSMVAVGLTGNTDMNPKAVADFSYESGFLISDLGTSWSLMTEGAASLGLNGKSISLDKKTIINTLGAGKPIIASMKPGHFTTEGHFIVLTGIDEETGKVMINDPDSQIRSHQTWDLSIIINECKNLWSFSLL